MEFFVDKVSRLYRRLTDDPEEVEFTVDKSFSCPVIKVVLPSGLWFYVDEDFIDQDPEISDIQLILDNSKFLFNERYDPVGSLRGRTDVLVSVLCE